MPELYVDKLSKRLEWRKEKIKIIKVEEQAAKDLEKLKKETLR